MLVGKSSVVCHKAWALQVKGTSQTAHKHQDGGCYTKFVAPSLIIFQINQLRFVAHPSSGSQVATWPWGKKTTIYLTAWGPRHWTEWPCTPQQVDVHTGLDHEWWEAPYVSVAPILLLKSGKRKNIQHKSGSGRVTFIEDFPIYCLYIFMYINIKLVCHFVQSHSWLLHAFSARSYQRTQTTWGHSR